MNYVFLITDYRYLIPEGAIAQLGERLHGMQEVGGSIPPGSTTLRQRALILQKPCFATTAAVKSAIQSKNKHRNPLTIRSNNAGS